MSYRTIEEKFLADFERLEQENEKLAARVAELEESLGLAKHALHRYADVCERKDE